MMWPMWNGPFAYGNAVVTKSVLVFIRATMRDRDFSLHFKHVRE
jgi:hypothetical protein